jgi:hypothetical protein
VAGGPQEEVQRSGKHLLWLQEKLTQWQVDLRLQHFPLFQGLQDSMQTEQQVENQWLAEVRASGPSAWGTITISSPDTLLEH